MSKENSTVYVKMLKDFEVDGRTVRKGKQGSFAYAVASAMIKKGAAKEIIIISGLDDIVKPKVKVAKKSPPKTKEEKFNK